MSDTLVPTVKPATPAPAALTAVVYRPRAKDWVFLQGVQDAIDKQGKADCSAIARELNVTKQAVWKRLQRPDFAEWVNHELRRAFDETWPKILYKLALLALKGSPEHMKLAAQLRGELGRGAGDDPQTSAIGTPTTFNVVAANVTMLIPRPPAPSA